MGREKGRWKKEGNLGQREGKKEKQKDEEKKEKKNGWKVSRVLSNKRNLVC